MGSHWCWEICPWAFQCFVCLKQQDMLRWVPMKTDRTLHWSYIFTFLAQAPTAITGFISGISPIQVATPALVLA